MTKNKSDLVKAIMVENELTEKEATQAVDVTFAAIKGFYERDEKLTLQGFGSFENNERAARKGRNPQTGEEIDIPAAKVPKVKLSKTFRDSISEQLK